MQEFTGASKKWDVSAVSAVPGAAFGAFQPFRQCPERSEMTDPSSKRDFVSVFRNNTDKNQIKKPICHYKAQNASKLRANLLKWAQTMTDRLILKKSGSLLYTCLYDR